jgi:hypothetical protein
MAVQRFAVTLRFTATTDANCRVEIWGIPLAPMRNPAEYQPRQAL